MGRIHHPNNRISNFLVGPKCFISRHFGQLEITSKTPYVVDSHSPPKYYALKHVTFDEKISDFWSNFMQAHGSDDDWIYNKAIILTWFMQTGFGF